MSTLLLGLVSILLLGYTAWKDLEHRKQIERMTLLLKAKDVPEFVQAEATAEPNPEAEPAADLVYPEDASAEDVIKAVNNHQSA